MLKLLNFTNKNSFMSVFLGIFSKFSEELFDCALLECFFFTVFMFNKTRFTYNSFLLRVSNTDVFIEFHFYLVKSFLVILLVSWKIFWFLVFAVFLKIRKFQGNQTNALIWWPVPSPTHKRHIFIFLPKNCKRNQLWNIP